MILDLTNAPISTKEQTVEAGDVYTTQSPLASTTTPTPDRLEIELPQAVKLFAHLAAAGFAGRPLLRKWPDLAYELIRPYKPPRNEVTVNRFSARLLTPLTTPVHESAFLSRLPVQ